MGGRADTCAKREELMFVLPQSIKIYVSTAPTSLRKSFEGLSNEIRQVLRSDPLSGHVFLFLNRLRTQIKMMVWTRGGFTIIHKRLEKGRFTFPSRISADEVCVEIDTHELSMLLEGLELATSRFSARWSPH
jgi:transposase